MDCTCPKPAALTTIAKVLCKENFGQIQRLLFQRRGFQFDAAADPVRPITALASWTPLFAAVGDTKVVSSPMIENFVIPRAEAITEGGGDNTTIDGKEIVLGAGAITPTGIIAEAPSSVIEAIKELMCETDLVFYFINQYGKIGAKKIETGVYEGIPLSSLFVSDADNKGLNTRDQADLRFALDYGWRAGVELITPADFNAKTDLWPA
jgi:hypothetical protein